MDSVLNVNRTTKRNLTAVGHERDLCNFIGSFIGKGELFPSAGKFHGFCDSGFPGVRSADNAVQPACEINGGFHSVLSDCRNSTYPCVYENWLFSFVIRFMMVS